jgi:uncharacterized membrane protein
LTGDIIGLALATLANIVPLLYVAVLAYTVYLSVTLRRALSVGEYRKQALGVGLVALAWMLLLLDYVVQAVTGSWAIFSVGFGLVMMTLFYWIDSSVLAARRTDPLVRDTLWWARLRYVLWALIVGATVGAASLASYYQATIGTEPWFMFNGQYGVGYMPAWFVLAAGVIALPVSASRARDKLLRRNIGWLGAFVILIQIVGFEPSSVANSQFGIFGVLFLASLCLHLSARSLVPHWIARGTGD